MEEMKCSICLASGAIPEEIGPTEDQCRICGAASCEWHGTEYRTGYEHEACHESPDYTRAEDGKY